MKKSPEEFIALSRGDRPDVVQKVFGNEFDINAAMGASKKPFDRVADELYRNMRLKELAALGNTDLNNILSKDALKMRIPNLCGVRRWLQTRPQILQKTL